MIEALAIIGGSTTALAVAVIAYLAYKLASVTPALVAAGKETIAAKQEAADFRAELTETRIRLKESDEQKAAVIVRLKLIEKQRNEAAEEATKRVVEEIRAKNARDAVTALDELLGTPLVPQAGDTGTDRGSG